MYRVWNELSENKKEGPFTANFICTLVLTFPKDLEYPTPKSAVLVMPYLSTTDFSINL